MSLRAWTALILTFLAAGCGAQERPTKTDGTWVGTITTEGNVTTVVNESGSVWGGTARLVEEASIGVDAGEDAYMLGAVAAVMAIDDEIFVVDRQVPVVRVYDMQGRHLRDLGAEGQGPGEFTRPRFMAATPDGRILLLDSGANRVNVYGPGPDDVDSWPLGVGQCCIHPMMVGRDGTLWVEGRIVNEDTGRFEDAVQAHGPDGPIGEPFAVPAYEYERWTYTANGREIEGVPMAPGVVWNIHPDGPLVAGASDRYRFEILSPDGRRTVVERFWDPVPVAQEEAEFWRRNLQERFARTEERTGNATEWDGRIPLTKPAFMRFLVSTSGEIWVARETRAEIIPNCETGASIDLALSTISSTGVRPPGACFTISYTIDVFGADGRYLGPVDWTLPHPYSFIRGDMVVAPTEDEAGTIMVKRYRLVLPGEEGR